MADPTRSARTDLPAPPQVGEGATNIYKPASGAWTPVGEIHTAKGKYGTAETWIISSWSGFLTSGTFEFALHGLDVPAVGDLRTAMNGAEAGLDQTLGSTVDRFWHEHFEEESIAWNSVTGVPITGASAWHVLCDARSGTPPSGDAGGDVRGILYRKVTTHTLTGGEVISKVEEDWLLANDYTAPNDTNAVFLVKQTAAPDFEDFVDDHEDGGTDWKTTSWTRLRIRYHISKTS